MINLSLQPQIGAIAGWKLEMSRVRSGAIASAAAAVSSAAEFSFSSGDYRGSVDATLVGGLAAGSYTIVVEDVSEQDFKKLTEAAGDKDPLQARLFMHWIDAPRPTFGTQGLVAVLRVTALRRRPGKWRYEMVVEGREWVYDRLLKRCPVVTGESPLDAALSVATAMSIETKGSFASVGIGEQWTTDPKRRAIDEMRRFEKAMVADAATGKKKRAGLGGMYLVRDGQLRLGPDRLEVPAEPPTLDAQSGLLAIERTGAVRENEQPIDVDALPAASGEETPAHRDRFVLTLRGRPDLKPGDVVRFEPPERGAFGEELGFALGPAVQAIDGTHITAYVEEVSHRLSREQGFFTLIRCVAAASGTGDLVERLWFDGIDADAGTGGSSESFLSRELDRARDSARIDRWPDVAQVRAQHRAGGTEPPLTERLWRGLAAPDGRQYAAARQAFAKGKQDLASAPYATPFAYGDWGLVLPRYPAMRVLVINRGGDPDDPVDVGALWQRGKGPAAKTGDWWLCLPVDVDGDRGPRASVDDTETVEPAQSGNAANDLIDARGNRVIEVGKLTIRIGKDRLRPPSQRPDAEADPVTIDHDGGKARITIAQDGGITITSAKTLTLTAAEGITLESDGNVAINVKGKLNVAKKAT